MELKNMYFWNTLYPPLGKGAAPALSAVKEAPAPSLV